MTDYTISFAGLHISILYDTEKAFQFLSTLFRDVTGEAVEENEIVISIAQSDVPGEYTLTSPGSAAFTADLGVRFAAVLFDVVIYNILNRNAHGIAFHAGAVVCEDKVILLPGLSGYGKSSMTACLVSNGCSYLTDELYFMPVNEHAPNLPFTRPVCIKSDGAAAVRELIAEHVLENAIVDKHGFVIPHRLLNPEFQQKSAAPALILIPKYQADAALSLEKLSAAQVTTQLMACDVNGRNLEGHGFRQVAQIARSTPAYRITYSSFIGVRGVMQDLFADLHWK
jgi:hypothetical protein